MKKIYGLSRNRDASGKVVKRNLNDYVNCIHASVGGGLRKHVGISAGGK